jgi:ribosomal-protein-alanine N-acetyltransferase
MAFFRTVSFSEQLPAIVGDGVVLRAPQMSDYAEWATLRDAKPGFPHLKPTWPADDLTRSAFRRRIKRYTEDQRGIWPIRSSSCTAATRSCSAG